MFNQIILVWFLLTLGLAFPTFRSHKREVNTTALAQSVNSSSTNNVITSYGKPYAVWQPKAFIVSMFGSERDPWLQSLDFTQNITIPGLSPLYPTILCTSNYTICQVTTGEGEINAAASITALTLSPLFDLSKTYFLIAGIAGGDPQYTTIGGVAFAKYAVQVGSEYQIDYTDYYKTNSNWTTGYFGYGTKNQTTYPKTVYGTEVFEVNANLRDRAVALALQVELNNGTTQNARFRSLYNFTVARSNPGIYRCDTLTSDTYFTGNALSNYFGNFTKILTNNSATYCVTAQEDNASLEAFTRAQKYGLVDFDRIVVMRSVSDFARPPPSLQNNTYNFFTNTSEGGDAAAFQNLVNAGQPLIYDIVQNWKSVYESGSKYKSTNYVGDIFGTLGGTPDFGRKDFVIA